MALDARAALELADWRTRVAELYLGIVGTGPEPWERFRAGRDRLFAEHPSSALTADQRRGFEGLPYFPYDASARVTCGLLEPRDPGELEIDSGGDDV